MPPASPNRQKLIDTAVDLFSQNGYDGVSIRDLCRAVGIKESSFYNHFRGKDELLAHILDLFRGRYRQLQPVERMLEVLAQLGEPEDFLKDTVRQMLDLLDDPTMRKIHRILNLEQYRNPLARSLLYEETLQRPLRFAELAFEKFAAQGKIHARNPQMLALEYILPIQALYLQYLTLDAAGEDTALLVRQLNEHADFFGQWLQG
jgi:AcrR family transcriptional regulator